MGRFLFVVPPILGHVYPTLAVGRELMERGHEVTWAGHTAYLDGYIPDWVPFVALADELPEGVADRLKPSGRNQGGLAAFIKVWRDFVVPVAHQMAPPLHELVERYRPDAMIVDQQALAGAIVAHLRGIPWATSATTAVEVIAYAAAQNADRAHEIVDPATLSYLLKVGEWLTDTLRQLDLDLGIDPADVDAFDPRYSPHRLIAYTTKELFGFEAKVPDHFTFVGPSIGERPPSMPFPWEWLDKTKPLVLVTLGTINYRNGDRFFRTAAEAIADMDIQAVFICPEGPEFDVPDNVLVCEKVPQLELLDHVDAVVSHGGQGTVSETLRVGRPLVIAPIRDDQPIVAGQVTNAGAGLTVRFGRVTTDELRGALDAVLTDKRFRAAAERVQASFAAAGGAALAADCFEQLLELPRTPAS
jgi:MGT family glycosyltransferase